MDDEDRFEWDSRKAVANMKKHDITFEQAIKVFHDPYAFEQVDERKDYGEERINLIGMCDGIILHVTYTERGERIRLISARKAKRYERDNYYR
jgi:uncharacterized protein